MLWVLKGPSQRDGSFEHPKHMLKLIGKKNYSFTLKNFVAVTYRYCTLLEISCSHQIGSNQKR